MKYQLGTQGMAFAGVTYAGGSIVDLDLDPETEAYWLRYGHLTRVVEAAAGSSGVSATNDALTDEEEDL